MGNVRRRTKWYGMSSRLSCSNTSQARKDINASSWNRNTVRYSTDMEERVEVESGRGVG